MAAVESILATKDMPFCPGCGHTVVANMLARVLKDLNIDPLDVIEVSDIGCCGLIDGVLRTHTVHGLHGRATALAMGIRLGLENPDKKVVVIMGDGGATIGLQHLLEAARQNVDITVILEDNMVYGMTGGQVSGLTPEPLKERKAPQETEVPPFDIVELVHVAGASYAAREIVGPKIADKLKKALQTPGFALVEIVEMCPSHGLKKIKELEQISRFPAVENEHPHPARRLQARKQPSLLDDLPRYPVPPMSPLQRPYRVLIAGSAGGGVQSAAQFLAQAGLAAGAFATKKGEYPITVGTGFSIAEVILSPHPIYYTGIEQPDVAIVVSVDGWQKIRSRIYPETRLLVDRTVPVEGDGNLQRFDWQKQAGARGAALLGIATWLQQEGVLPLETLKQVVLAHPKGERFWSGIDAGLEEKKSGEN